VIAESNGTKPGLLLAGHLDTVPGDKESWRFDPFEAKIHNGKIYGLGTSDMKSGVAALLMALKKSLSEKPKRKVILALVGDEEVSLKGSRFLIAREKDFLKLARYGVIAEPTDLKVVVAQKGLLHVKIIFSGKRSHGSTPWLGDNAILKAVEFLNEVKKLSEKLVKVKDPFLGSATINVGKITGGVKVNIVPDKCEIQIDRRVVQPETIEKCLNEFKRILSELKIKAKIEIMGMPKLPFKVNENSKIVRVLRELTNAKLIGETGYTEAEIYGKIGIDCVVFGPTKKAHISDEYVRIKDLIAVEKIYEKLIRKMCF
jgi:succinyl-diaminopimelate desuccinylase